MGQVSAARANLQTILDNLTAGVIVLDDHGVIQSANPGATRILRVPLAACRGRRCRKRCQAWKPLAPAVQKQFEDYLRERQEHGLDHWQQSFELGRPQVRQDTNAITLVARGAASMPGQGLAAGV
jgi:nitrogen fixation/metabolism regulation signal transduction histidine kinase